jgi:hypothetical protein
MPFHKGIGKMVFRCILLALLSSACATPLDAPTEPGFGVYLLKETTPELAAALGLRHLQGVVVSEVLENSAADIAGLRRGDVILEFDGVAVVDWVEFAILVRETPTGRAVVLKIFREEEPHRVHAIMGENARDYAKRQLGVEGELLDFASTLAESGARRHKERDYSLAEERYREALDIIDEELSGHITREDEQWIASLVSHLGLLYYDQENLEAAEPLLVRALEMYENLGNEQHIATALYNLASLNLAIDNVEAAQQLAERSLKIYARLRELHNSSNEELTIDEITALLVQIYRAKGDHATADRIEQGMGAGDGKREDEVLEPACAKVPGC